MFESVKSFCDSFLEMGVPGGDLYIKQDGKELLRYTFGYSDLENQIPVKGNERYYLYSCSKPITCVAALQLWEKGLFKLDDPLSDYLPEFAEMTVKTEDGIRKAKTPILIRNLFTMTAGLQLRSADSCHPQGAGGNKFCFPHPGGGPCHCSGTPGFRSR